MMDKQLDYYINKDQEIKWTWLKQS
jgi:hypothetical protein